MRWTKVVVVTVSFLSIVWAQDPFSEARDNRNVKPASFPDSSSTAFRLKDYAPAINSQIITNIDSNSTFYMDIDENGTKFYSEKLNLATKHINHDTNLSYFQPNNTQLMEMFKDRKGVAASDFLNRMSQNSSMMKEMQSKRGDQLKKQYIHDTYGGSKEVINMQTVDNLQARLFATAAKPTTIKCYVKRTMIPKFYCPVTGKSYGARVGGRAEDNIDAVKRQCETFCKSESFGCRNVPTGGKLFTPANIDLIFDPNMTSGMTTKSMAFDFNINQKVKWVKYSYLIEWSELALEKNITDLRPIIEFTTSAYRLEQEQSPTAEMTLVSDRYPYQTSEMYGELAMHSFDQAAKGMLMFYPPKLIKTGAFAGYELKDIVKKITIHGVDIQYMDNRYFFCGLTQVVTDATTQCNDGVVYDVNSSDGFFRICKSNHTARGPEPKYGAYYTDNECNDACHEESKCVETYEDYLTVTGTNQYKITIGCDSDPLNSACTDTLCRQYFKDRTMPVEESVYDRDGGIRRTVATGVQSPGMIRPKIDIEAELAATNSLSPESAYKSIFDQAKKDGSYQAMIEKGTFNYSKNTVGDGEPAENAVRIVKPQATAANYSVAVTNKDLEIWWRLKPASKDIGSQIKHLYVVAKIEHVFVPVSGTFTTAQSPTGQASGTSNQSANMYKDILYAYVGQANMLKPFYLQEYAQVQNASLSDSLWSDNQSNRKDWYVAYASSSDTLVAASKDETGMIFKDKALSGVVNYEEYKVINDPKGSFSTSKSLLQSQEVVNISYPPIKHYGVYNSSTTGTLANFTFYGIYSSSTLTNAEIIKMLENGEKYQFYNALSADKNKQEIVGDGIMQSKNVKMFIKGGTSNMTVSAELTPSIEEEDKSATLFMFMFEKENR